MKGEITCERMTVGDVFSNLWFNVPAYQRPYVWGKDEVSEFLIDISDAMLEHESGNKAKYFLGSFVCQEQPPESNDSDVEFMESDLLDGQQRMITLFLLFVVLRSIADKAQAKEKCQKSIFQEGNEYDEVPERSRINFKIRVDTQDFLDRLAKEEGLCKDHDELEYIAEKNKDISVENMANSILHIFNFFEEREYISSDKFIRFLSNNVQLIKVSTEDFDDAFLLFTILNDRGIPLRGSDILKSKNLEELSTQQEREKYAKSWEDMENNLNTEFDNFLGYMRMILAKEKANSTLLQEFENKIYKIENPPITKGKETFDFIIKHSKNYQIIFDREFEVGNGFDCANLIYTIKNGLGTSDWIPPLLCYYGKFKDENLLLFLKLLDKKISADWIMGQTRGLIIANMCDIIEEIENAKDSKELLESKNLVFETKDLLPLLKEDIYGKRHARYLLLKLNYLQGSNKDCTVHKRISIEHILPQTPAPKSQWKNDFTEEEREQWTHKIGNLVLINRTKNSELSNLDYVIKCDKYFRKHVDVYPHSNYVLSVNSRWNPQSLKDNHNRCIDKLKEYYGID